MGWESFLHERPIGVIATVSPDGTPHATPVEVFVDGGKVYCWCQATSHKARNVARTGRAALVGYKGHAFALVRGGARLVRADDPAYRAIADGFLRKYERDEEYGNDTLIEITPQHVASERIE